MRLWVDYHNSLNVNQCNNMEGIEWDHILKVAPITTIVLGVVYASYWIVSKIYDGHIKSLREFIDYLKDRK